MFKVLVACWCRSASLCLRVGFFIAVGTIGQPLFAVGSYVGRLEEVWVNSEGSQDIGWVKPVGAIVNSSCTSTGWFIVDLTIPSVKQALTFALAALAAGREVRLYGTGACSSGNSYEYLRAVAVK